jgi:tRNA(Arg) A34 adenosine deaminase TadA
MHPDNQHLPFIEMAIRLSEQALLTGRGGPFGALIVREGEPIGSSGNCVFQNTDPTSHAEIMAIRDACANIQSPDLSGCTIYSSAEPCPMCLAAIYWARIDAIYFSGEADDAARAGFDDSFFYEELRAHRDIRTVPARRVLPERAWESFQVWIETPEKTEY